MICISYINTNLYHFLFLLVNKRLDEWVNEDSLDTRKVHFPRRDGGSNTGVSTPKKMHIGAGGSVSRCVCVLFF